MSLTKKLSSPLTYIEANEELDFPSNMAVANYNTNKLPFSKEELKLFLDDARSLNVEFEKSKTNLFSILQKYPNQVLIVLGIAIFALGLFLEKVFDLKIFSLLLYGLSVTSISSGAWLSLLVKDISENHEKSTYYLIHSQIGQSQISEKLSKGIFKKENKHFWLSNLDWYLDTTTENMFYFKNKFYSKEEVIKIVHEEYGETNANTFFLYLLSKPEEVFLNKIIGDIYELEKQCSTI